MIRDVEDEIPEPADEAAQWERWLTRFEAHILPIFMEHGYDRDFAMLAYFSQARGDE